MLAVLVFVFLSLLSVCCALKLNVPSFSAFGRVRSSVSKQSPAALNLKNEIRKLSKGTKNGITASESVRDEIDVKVKQLERLNPTKSNLNRSDQLNGEWRLVYTTNEGSSAGKLGPFVGDVIQDIDTDTKMYQNYVNIGPNALIQGALDATRENIYNNSWQVNFKQIEFKILGISLFKKPLSATGIWRKTYLDSDFRILYAKGGKNTQKENIYILVK